MRDAVEGNARDARTPPGVDWHALAAAVDQLRETLRAAVAGLVADGFTDDQARAIVTATITGGRK